MGILALLYLILTRRIKTLVDIIVKICSACLYFLELSSHMVYGNLGVALPDINQKKKIR